MIKDMKASVLKRRTRVILKSGKELYTPVKREEVMAVIAANGSLQTCDFEDVGIWEHTKLRATQVKKLVSLDEKEVHKKEFLSKERKKKRIAALRKHEERMLANPHIHKLAMYLRKQRCDRGWNYQDIADRLGISKTSVYAYEAGKRKIPRDKLKLYAKMFDTTFENLLAIEGVKTTKKSKAAA